MISDLIAKIRLTPDCIVFDPLPQEAWTNFKSILPEDVVEFYTLCGGLELFANKDYVYNILRPDELCYLDGDHYDECCCGEHVVSDYWVFVAERVYEKIAIDTHPNRLGRCYDCFVGEAHPVIALSFTELLQRLYDNKGEHPYWLQPEYPRLDPCDGFVPDGERMQPSTLIVNGYWLELIWGCGGVNVSLGTGIDRTIHPLKTDVSTLDMSNPDHVATVVEEYVKVYLGEHPAHIVERLKNTWRYALNAYSEEALKAGLQDIVLPFKLPPSAKQLYLQAWELMYPQESWLINDLSHYHDMDQPLVGLYVLD